MNTTVSMDTPWILRSTLVSNVWIPRQGSIQGLDTKTTKREYSWLVSKVEGARHYTAKVYKPSHPVAVRSSETLVMAAAGLPRGPHARSGSRSSLMSNFRAGGDPASSYVLCTRSGLKPQYPWILLGYWAFRWYPSFGYFGYWRTCQYPRFGY